MLLWLCLGIIQGRAIFRENILLRNDDFRRIYTSLYIYIYFAHIDDDDQFVFGQKTRAMKNVVVKKRTMMVKKKNK